MAPAALPTIKVYVGFTSTALGSAGQDVTDYVRSITINRGRNTELGNFDAATMTVVLDNNDGWFTPQPTTRVMPWSVTPMQLRPRKPISVTANTNGVTTTIASGIIERWPASIDNGDLTVTIPISDAFKLLTETQLPNSDSGFIAKSKPVNYFPLQGDDTAALQDTVTKTKLRINWSSPFTLSDAQFWAGQNSAPLPVVNYGDASVFPSGNDGSINLGAYWSSGGVHGAWGMNCDTAAALSYTAGFTISAAFSLPTLTHPDGTWTALFTRYDPAYTQWFDIVRVYPDGSVWVLGSTFAPAGTVKANYNYRITVAVIQTSAPDGFGGTIRTNTVRCNINGVDYSSTGGLFSPTGVGTLYIGGRGGMDGYGGGGRYAHIAVWDRALSTQEVGSVWGDYLVGPTLTADQRMNRLLDLIGWPASQRDIQPGKSILSRAPFSDNTSALSLLQQWAAADGGVVFMSPDGCVTFRNRHDRINYPLAPKWVFDSTSTTGVEEGLEWVMSDDDVTNIVNLEYANGVKVQIRNEASISEFGEKPEDLSPDIIDNEQARDMADWMLTQYAQPVIRVTGVSIYPTAGEDQALWTAAIQADVGDVIRLTGLPATAPAATMDYVIESVNHEIVPAGASGGRIDWKTSFDVSPLPVSAWVLGGNAPRNLVSDAAFGAETGAGVTHSLGKFTLTTPTDATAPEGGKIQRWTAVASYAANQAIFAATYATPMPYMWASMGVWVRTPVARQVKISLQYWNDATGATYTNLDSPIVTTVANQWTFLKVEGLQAGATPYNVYGQVLLVGAGSTGDVIDIDAFVVQPERDYKPWSIDALGTDTRLAS